MGFATKIATAAAFAVMTAASASAQQSVTFSTTGCFAGTPTSGCTNSSADGFFSFTGAGSSSYSLTSGVAQTVNLGLFGVTGPNTGSGVNDNFNLWLAFTNPPGVTQNDAATVSGKLQGANSVTLDFANNGLQNVFTYGDGGTLQLSVADHVFPSEGSAQLQGTLLYTAGTITSTPEPGSMALLATGLVGLVPMVRRRRK